MDERKLVLWIAKNALISKIPSRVGRVEWVTHTYVTYMLYIYTYICNLRNNIDHEKNS